jgi:Zn-dependent protease with chaperone function
VYLAGCGPQLQVPRVSQATIEQERGKQLEMAFKLRLERLEQLFRVYTPLRLKNAELCGDAVDPITGMYFVTAESFTKEDREIARRVLKLGDGVKVLYVASGSPAAKAGLLPGDVIISLASGAGVVPRDDGWSMLSLERVATVVRNAGYQPITLRVRRQQETFLVPLIPEPGCRYPVQLSEDYNVDAGSNRYEIEVSAGLLQFVRDDNQLALVLGHELAHIMLGHIDRTKTNRAIGRLLGGTVDIGAALAGVNTRWAGAKAGTRAGGAAYSQAFESEADYLGLYLTARAGFEIDGTPDFWRQMGAEGHQHILSSYKTTHPSAPERAAMLEETVKEIRDKLATGQPLVPKRIEPAQDSGSSDTAQP